jgi:hypothetical protein
MNQSREIWDKNVQRIKNSDLDIDIEEEKNKELADKCGKKTLKSQQKFGTAGRLKTHSRQPSRSPDVVSLRKTIS